LDKYSCDDGADLDDSDDENENETNGDVEGNADSAPPESEDERLKRFPWLRGGTKGGEEEGIEWDEVDKRPLY
jgi:hypothetical protein